MVRDLESNNIVMDVYLKDDTNYYDCDTPSVPIPDHGKVVMFWDGQDFMIIPMEQVYRLVMHESETGNK